MVLDFPVMADYAAIPEGKRLIYLTHGHVYNAGHLPPLCPGDVLIHGHTHVPCCEAAEGVQVLNPGSVSIPKAGSWHGYMTLESGAFRWLDMDARERMSWRME